MPSTRWSLRCLTVRPRAQQWKAILPWETQLSLQTCKHTKMESRWESQLIKQLFCKIRFLQPVDQAISKVSLLATLTTSAATVEILDQTTSKAKLLQTARVEPLKFAIRKEDNRSKAYTACKIWVKPNLQYFKLVQWSKQTKRSRKFHRKRKFLTKRIEL